MNWFNERYVKCTNCNLITFLKSEKGQTIVEYALLLVLIAIVVIAMVSGLGTQSNQSLSKVNNALQ